MLFRSICTALLHFVCFLNVVASNYGMMLYVNHRQLVGILEQAFNINQVDNIFRCVDFMHSFIDPDYMVLMDNIKSSFPHVFTKQNIARWRNSRDISPEWMRYIRVSTRSKENIMSQNMHIVHILHTLSIKDRRGLAFSIEDRVIHMTDIIHEHIAQ